MNDLLPREIESNSQPKFEDFDKIVFDFSPDTSRGKLVITGHGEKGAGKTTGIFLITTGRMGGFPAGKTNVISFDNKSKITAEQYFPNDNITVWDGKQHYREDPSLCTHSGMKTYKYIQGLLQDWNKKPESRPDWIVFDGFTIMAVILEMAMRYKHNLQPSEGVANRNVWKDRARFVQDLHNLACRTAKYGVAYTTYTDKPNIVEDGTVITKGDQPKYIDVVMQETDVVLHMTKAKGKDGDLFYMRVESTKYKQYVDMEGKPIPKVITTLEQGRTFDITKLVDMVPAKISKPIEKQIVTEVKPVEKQNTAPVVTISEFIKATGMEPAKPSEPAKPMESTKPTETVKPAEPKKEYIISNPIDL